MELFAAVDFDSFHNISLSLTHTHTQHWYKVQIMPDKPKPAKRHDHTAVCISGPLFGQIKPMVLIAGGRDSRWQNLGDLWILDCSIGMWTKVITNTH